MKNFWQTLPRPFFVMAPMEQVTDTVYRQIIASCAKPDVFFTEFTNVSGMLSKGKDHVIHRFQHTSEERPLIAQIWGTNPEEFFKAAQYLQTQEFDGIDINMGCPERGVVGNGAGSGLINTPNLAKEIIKATKEGAGDLPVSVKTRLGLKTIQTEYWTETLLSCDIAALTLHCRTQAEMSRVPAHIEELAKAVSIRNRMKKDTVLIANGDIQSRSTGEAIAQKYGIDGVMIGRGIFEDLWIFSRSTQRAPVAYLEKLIEHTDLFEKTWGEKKQFKILRKFYKVYVKDFDGANILRTQLMETTNADEVHALVIPVLEKLKQHT